MSKLPNLKHDVESWIASSGADRVADYAARGRKHQHLDDNDLVDGWTNAFKRMADDVRDYDRRSEEEDYKSEFVLRKKSPPYDLIRDDFNRYIIGTDRAIEELKNDDPVQYENMTRGISEDLNTFKSSRDKFKN